MKKLFVMMLIGSLIFGITGCFGIRDNNSDSKNESVEATKENVATEEKTEKETENEAEKKYNTAKSLFEESNLVDAQKIFLKIKDYSDSQKYLDEIGIKLYEEAKEYYNQKDYVGCANAIDKIDTAEEWKDFAKAELLFETAKKEYIDNVEAEAILILRKDGYDEFVSFVKGKENILYSGNESKSFVEEYKPVYLMNLETYAEDGYIHVGPKYSYNTTVSASGVYKDNLGNVYPWGMNRRVPNFSMSKSYMEYKVTQYNYLSGTLILNYETRSNTDAGYMRVYGDDVLIYTSPEICKGFDPIYITIDISSADVIRIEFDGEYQNVSFIEPSLSK